MTRAEYHTRFKGSCAHHQYHQQIPLQSPRLLRHAAADILYAASSEPASSPPCTPLTFPSSPSPTHAPRLTTEGHTGPSACLHRTTATLTTPTRLTKQRPAVWIRAAATIPKFRRYGWLHGWTVYELHDRPRDADGLADGPKRHEGWTGLCGAERT